MSTIEERFRVVADDAVIITQPAPPTGTRTIAPNDERFRVLAEETVLIGLPAGLPGPAGPPGPAGATGPQGDPGKSTSVLPYSFNMSTVLTPNDGEIRLNSANQTAATNMRVAYRTAQGGNVQALVFVIDAGDLLTLQSGADVNRVQRYTVTGPPTQNGGANGYMDIPVSWHSGGNALTNEPITLNLAYVGPAGPQGAPGAPGAAGTQGPRGWSASLFGYVYGQDTDNTPDPGIVQFDNPDLSVARFAYISTTDVSGQPNVSSLRALGTGDELTMALAAVPDQFVTFDVTGPSSGLEPVVTVPIWMTATELTGPVIANTDVVLSLGLRGSQGPQGPGASWTPEDQGFLAWNGDPAQMVSTASPPGAAGSLYVVRINVRAPISVSRIWTVMQAGGTGLIAGQCFQALYRQDLTLVAQSADMSTAWGTAGTKEALLQGGPYNVPAGFCYAAMWFNATTAPVWYRFQTSAANNLNLSAGTYRSGIGPVATTAAPANISGFGRHDILIWMALG